MSLVHIYFKELGIIKYSREELYSIMDVIGKTCFLLHDSFLAHFLISAAFGGIVGLCMGFSLLSLAEFFYFFTLRLFVDCRRERKEFNRKLNEHNEKQAKKGGKGGSKA